MPPAVPKPKKTRKRVAESTVLNLWKKVVFARARGLCEYPGCTVNFTQLHPHHYFNKKNKSVKYDPINGIALCAHHHTLGNQAAHLDPDFKEIWLSSGKRPPGWIEELTERKNQRVKDNDDYRERWKVKLELLLDIEYKKAKEAIK